MTLGIGGSTPEQELASLSDMTSGVVSIQPEEFQMRLDRAQALIRENGMDAIYVNAGTNLYYFTGTHWHPSERMMGAIIPANGPIQYIGPAFEEATIKDFMEVKSELHGWQEHESPYQLFHKILADMGLSSGVIGLDESVPFFISDGVQQAAPNFRYCNAKPVTAGCRMQKSDAEIALLQRAKNMTLEVHKSAARILKEGISTTEVNAFIHEAHKAVGAPAGSYFCIVLFGEASAYPHGVKDPQILKDGDMVLIDTGCQVEGYISDITRSYVFGEPSARQREVWNVEKAAQASAFEAAAIGVPCGETDVAARKTLEASGFGPEYKIPGLPHRTGHGIGLDIHEWPYLVRSDQTPLAPGMCFSNEPMICIPGEFGIRHEDHFYMTEDGPRWFTQPAHSIDDPFGYEA